MLPGRPRIWTPKAVARALLIALAVVAPLLAGVAEYERTELWRERCRRQADYLESAAESCIRFSDPKYINELEAKGLDPAKVARLRADVQVRRERARLYASLREKWLLGTWVPWVDIKPDPPGVPQDLPFGWERYGW